MTSIINFTIRCGRPNTNLTMRAFNGGRLTAKLVLPSTSKIEGRIHTSAIQRSEIKYALPNDPSHGSKHWVGERVVAVGLLAAIPAAAIYQLPVLDHALAVGLPLHSYWGVKAIISDYFWRPGVPVAKATWLMCCVLTGAGLMYLNVYDIGISKFFIKLMSL